MINKEIVTIGSEIMEEIKLEIQGEKKDVWEKMLGWDWIIWTQNLINVGQMI